MTPRRPIFLLIAFLLACFALAACSPSAMTGGMTGGAIGLFLLGMLLAGTTATTQTGCIDVGPCLSIDRVPPEDMGDDMLDDMTDEDMVPEVGPCLSQPPPDMSMFEDGLSPDNRPDKLAPPSDRAQERERLLAKLSDRLPADVLAKLGGHSDDA